MSRSDRTAFLWTSALLFGVALIAFVVGPRPPQPPTSAEIRQTVAQHLDAVARTRTDRGKTMHALAVYLLGEQRSAAPSAVTSNQIAHIASLVVDRDSDVARLALRILKGLGPSARPAAERLMAYLDSQPNLRFDRFAWDVEFALRGSEPSIREVFDLIAAMKRGTPEQQAELARRLAMLTDYLIVHSDRVKPEFFVGPATEALADILRQRDAPESVLVSAARALGSLGPIAKGAIPALESALAEAKVSESEFIVCAGGLCLSLADEYRRALTCVRMDREQFEIEHRFARRSCEFTSEPD